jgi:hypothetical protein
MQQLLRGTEQDTWLVIQCAPLVPASAEAIAAVVEHAQTQYQQSSASFLTAASARYAFFLLY